MAENTPEVVEVRKVRIEYSIAVPNIPPPPPLNLDALADVVAAKLARAGTKRTPL